MRKFTILLVVLLAAATMQAQLILNGEYRPRVDFDHGNKTLQSMQDQMFGLNTSQRTRLGVFYDTKKYKFGMQFQDVRAWGATKQLVVGDGAYTTIHQAWGEVLLTNEFSVKIGRQELVYDDSRILGNVNWAQQARSHDLVLFKYVKKDDLEVHFGAAVNQVQTKAYPVAGNYKSMQFLWINKKIGDLSISALALNNGVEDVILNNIAVKPMTTYSQIIGMRPEYKMGKLKMGANFYYQMGKSTATYYDNVDKIDRHKNISAYNFRLDMSYQVTKCLKATVGFEMLSGQSQTDTTFDYSKKTQHAFTPLYGTNHKFNGWMDYFYVGNHKNNVGLNDAFLMLDYKKEKLMAGAHFHYFMANANVIDVVNSTPTDIKALGSGLGMELDLYVGYKYAKDVVFKAGVSGMFDTETLRAVKVPAAYGASNWSAWVMMVMKPTFLNGTKKVAPKK